MCLSVWASRAMVPDLGRRFHKAGLRVTMEQQRALAHLCDREGLTQNDLAGLLLRGKTRAIRLLTGMQRRGCITRASMPGTAAAPACASRTRAGRSVARERFRPDCLGKRGNPAAGPAPDHRYPRGQPQSYVQDVAACGVARVTECGKLRRRAKAAATSAAWKQTNGLRQRRAGSDCFSCRCICLGRRETPGSPPPGFANKKTNPRRTQRPAGVFPDGGPPRGDASAILPFSCVRR